MIRVTVELLPGGDASRPKHLGTCLIANDLEDSSESDGRLGSYLIALSKWGRPITSIRTAAQRDVWRRGRITGFRRRSRGPWDLLYLALRETVGDRNP